MGCIEQGIDPYNLKELQNNLGKQGYNFIYVAETASTMPLMEEYAFAGHPPPAVAITDHQTTGIGREGRIWRDKPGCSVLMSVYQGLEKPSLLALLADLMTLKAALSIREISGVTGLKIKWPNDFVVDDKKTGGLLAQNILDGKDYKGANLGLGINIHYSSEELSSYPVDYSPTALDLHAGSLIARQAVVTSVLGSIRYLPVDAIVVESNIGLRQDYNNTWRDISSVMGRKVQVLRGQEEYLSGQVADLEIGGRLCVENLRQRHWLSHFDTQMKVRMLD